MIRRIAGLSMTPIITKSSTTYTEADFKRIAEAIDKKKEEVSRCGREFEAGAVWYRLDNKAPRRIAPSILQRKLRQISKNVQRLLKNLGIEDPADAPDGPGDISIFDVLASVDGTTDGKVAVATARLGRMVAILAGIEVAWELDRLSREASVDVELIGEMTVAKEHQGDAAVNNWAASMFGIYCSITGSKPKTSVGGPDQPNEGIASGPLIRFLQAAGAPLEINYDEDAWRSRVRTILDNST